MKTLWHLGRRFWREERGVALVLVSVMLPVIIGFALLALDMSRANNLHNDLQKGADSFAIAGAAELDGKPDAITRADRALLNLVDNRSRFSADANGAQLPQQLLTSAGITRRFLKDLPANDWDPIVAANVTVLPDEAIFIEVTVNPTGFASIFPASFLTGNTADNGFNIAATAVAGFGSAVCDFTPVFMCNPYERPEEVGGIDLYEAAASSEYRRRQIELRSVGGSSEYFPGNFGFLDSPGANGARALAEMIASAKPRTCYSRRGVDTKTGQNSGPVKAAINLRFGIQEPGTGSWNSAEYGPAKNVRKGAVRESGNPNQCPSSNQLTFGAPNEGLPIDSCFAAENCPLMYGRMGDTNWDFQPYWTTNHGSNPYPASWDATPPTRYEIYDYETNVVPARTADVSGGGETGTPPSMCGAPVTSVDRRLLYGAVLNCRTLEEQGYDLGGHEVGLPVEAFASFFMTDPVRKEPQSEFDASIFVELVDVTGGGQGTLSNFLRDEVQLYR